MKSRVNGSHHVVMDILGNHKDDLNQSLMLVLWIKHQGRGCTISDLFFEYAKVKGIFEPMSKSTEHYACEEFVTPMNQSRNSNKKENLKPCKASDPNARHRLKFDKQRKRKFTPGLMIAWHGSLIYHGGKAEDKECTSCYWGPLPYGTYTSFILNTFTNNVCESCGKFIHLVENSASRPKKGTANYDPIFKCRKLMERIMNKMTILWISGESVCIDERMILYTGRSIVFVHYMPLKSINRGIKLFMLTCNSHKLGW